jgi:hypothetical protein
VGAGRCRSAGRGGSGVSGFDTRSFATVSSRREDEWIARTPSARGTNQLPPDEDPPK